MMNAITETEHSRAPDHVTHTGPDPVAVAALVYLCTADDDELPDWIINWIRSGAWAAVMLNAGPREAFGLKGRDGNRDAVSAAREQVALMHLHKAAEILASDGDPDEQARAVTHAMESIRSGNHKDVDDQVLRPLRTADHLRGIPATKKHIKQLLRNGREP